MTCWGYATPLGVLVPECGGEGDMGGTSDGERVAARRGELIADVGLVRC